MISVQTDLFAPPARGAPYQRKSATSRAAAERVRPHIGNHERDVFNAIVAAGARSITRKELAAAIGWAEHQQNRITGRVASLLEKGGVRETDARRDGSKVLVAAVEGR